MKADGSVVAWGQSYYGQVSDTPTTSDFTQVAAGYYHSLALDAAPQLTVSNLVAGQTAVLSVEHASSGALVFPAYSLAGGGPISTPWGAGFLTPPYVQLPTMFADASGIAAMSASVPTGFSGVSVWLQALDWESKTLSTGLALTVQ